MRLAARAHRNVLRSRPANAVDAVTEEAAYEVGLGSQRRVICSRAESIVLAVTWPARREPLSHQNPVVSARYLRPGVYRQAIVGELAARL
jgi:hypothetical protein